MLNRRHLRVKVLQTIYAYQQSDDKNVNSFEKALLKSVDQVYEMYIWVLALVTEVADYAIIDAEERANKYLPNENDLNANTRLANNTFIELLKLNEQFVELAKKYKVNAVFDAELTRNIFHILKQSPEYIAYLEADDRTLKVEKDIIKFIFKKIILRSPAIEQVFDEHFINWTTDKDVLQALLAKTLKNFNSEDAEQNQLAQLCPNWADDKAFIVDLFRLTVRHADEYQQYITGKTKNWEADRIALIDTLLMKMAIAELLNFSSIPVKVTINEYIEISKEFSTPKSNSFINGILDKILIELQKEGKIRKFGRGLIG